MNKKYKCFWCNKKFVDLEKHTRNMHPKLTARSYDYPKAEGNEITMGIEEKGYTVQCINCLCILGISSENFQEREIYCMRCAKEKIKATQNTSNQNQRKKDEKVASRIAHLETQSVQEEDNTQVKCKTKNVDNPVDTDALTNPSFNEVIRNDGRRKNPNDCSGQANVADKEDTNKCVLRSDLKSKLDDKDS